MLGLEFLDRGAVTLAVGAPAGDSVTASGMRDTAKYLGAGGATLVVIADPATLVLRGLMAPAVDLLLEQLRLEIGRCLPALITHAVTIVSASLGRETPALDATRLAAFAPA